MPEVLIINKKRVESFVGNLSRRLPKDAEELIDELIMFSAKQYRLAAQNAGIRNWKGDLYSALRKQEDKPRKTSRFSGYVFMPIHGVYLDKMEPHFVPFKYRKIRRWAFEKLGLEAHFMKGVFVKPHPFILRAEGHIKTRLTKMVKKKIKKTVRGAMK